MSYHTLMANYWLSGTGLIEIRRNEFPSKIRPISHAELPLDRFRVLLRRFSLDSLHTRLTHLCTYNSEFLGMIHDISMTTALSKYSYILQFDTIMTCTKVECMASDFNFISLFVRTERRSYSSYFHLLVSVNERLFFAV